MIISAEPTGHRAELGVLAISGSCSSAVASRSATS